MRHPLPHGFTLIELLVALAVLSIAAGAFLHAISVHSLNSTRLRDQTLAHWISINRINEIKIKKGWPQPGTQRGQSSQGGQQWHWLQSTSTTPNPLIRRVEIQVLRREDNPPLTRLIAYLTAPEQK